MFSKKLPKKQLELGSNTESYHKRMKLSNHQKKLDSSKNWTLRKKYQLFSTDTLKTNEPIKRHTIEDTYEVKADTIAYENTDQVGVRAKLRRTVSENSKDLKASAYVHIKGKRKAPPPPVLVQKSDPSSAVTTLRSTSSRKKQPAPLPPLLLKNSSKPKQYSSSLLDDKDIQALLNTRCFESQNPPSSITVPKSDLSLSTQLSPATNLSEEQKQIVIDNILKSQGSNLDYKTKDMDKNQLLNTSKENIPSFLLEDNVFTIDKGVYKFYKPESSKENLEEVSDLASLSPVSPKPWYKRANNTTKESSSILSFKKDFLLRTLDRNKNKNKILEEDLPELPFCRNFMKENDQELRLRCKSLKSKEIQHGSEKRVSAIRIPNISELDREAAEILGQTTKEEHLQKLESSQEISSSNSTRDLINKFESVSQQSKITLNPAFVRNEKPLEDNKLNNTSPLFSFRKNMKTNTTNAEVFFKAWNCSYCTFENPSWKIVCLACEKLKPCDNIKKYFGSEKNSTEEKCQNDRKKYNNGTNNNENDWDRKKLQVLKYFKLNEPNISLEQADKRFIPTSSLKDNFSGHITNFNKNLNENNSLVLIEEEQKKTDGFEISLLIPANANSLCEKNINCTVENEVNDHKTLNQKSAPILSSLNIPEQKLFDNSQRSSSPKNTISSLVNEQRKKEINHLEITYKDTIFARKEVFVVNQAYVAPTDLFQEQVNKLNVGEIGALNIIPDKESMENKIMNEKDETTSQCNFNAKQHTIMSSNTLKPLETKNILVENDKIDDRRNLFANKEELEKEKTRLREIIQEMNAKALADKYPNLRNDVKPFEDNIIVSPNNDINDEQKFGAVKKPIQKNDKFKVSSAVQTSSAIKKLENDNTNKPTNTTSKPTLKPLANLDRAKLRRQFRSQKGLQNFTASLKFPSKLLNSSNTLVINKLLRNLENSIAEGSFDQAAGYAIELAKLKVALSVTRQKDKSSLIADKQAPVEIIQ